MAGGPTADASTEALLVETRRRAGFINRYVDMIPARFYLSSEALQAHKPRTGLDPAQYKPTSQLLVEVLTASAEASAGSSQASSSKKKKAKKQIKPTDEEEAPSSRADLRKLLERRIAELKEERKRKQSEKDRAKHVADKEKEVESVKAKKPRRSEATASTGEDEVEAGRLAFDPKTSDLPFEARVNRRGHKVRQLQTALRKEEDRKRKLDEAENQEEREELRKNFAMDAAMRRARGEKVHDDVGRLRKAHKQMETGKRKGKEKWDARVEANTKLAQEKQSQRKDNLKNRRSAKKDAAKARAGFEGKKQGYLNEE